MTRSQPHEPIAQADVDAAEEQIVEQSKRIDFYLTEYSVELLATKMHEGEFVVPQYQREYTWESERKSRFVESLVMGLPIPFLFFWEMPDGKLEIVDGSQRLRTIEEFIFGGLQLGSLEALSLASGFSFSDLPESRQRKIRNRSIRGIVLNEHADEQARLDMFDRINTSSKVANKAEVRRGVLAGPFMDLVIALAEDPLFVELAPMSKKLASEREREELVTRFFAYGDGLGDYHDQPARFIFSYAKSMNRRIAEEPELAGSYRERFRRTMEFVRDRFPYGFRRGPKGAATPRARFEAIAIGSYLAQVEWPEITNAPPMDMSWLESKDFSDVTGSDGANALARLSNRMGFVRDKLLAR